MTYLIIFLMVNKVIDTEVILIVISTNGLIPVSLAHHLRRLGFFGNSLVAKMQKAVGLDSARIFTSVS